MKPKCLRYYAHSAEGLRNGSFWREIQWDRRGKDISFGEFINGDFMGTVKELPKDHGLTEYDVKTANLLIPSVCK